MSAAYGGGKGKLLIPGVCVNTKYKICLLCMFRGMYIYFISFMNGFSRPSVK